MARQGRPESPLERTSSGELYRGSRIREQRQEKGLSREELAKLLNCHPDTLSKLETNGSNPTPEMLSMIAKVLEVSPEYFQQAPVHPRLLKTKTATLRSPLAPSPQEILMHRLAIAEERLEAAQKMFVAAWQHLQDVSGEIRELKAFAADMQNEE